MKRNKEKKKWSTNTNKMKSEIYIQIENKSIRAWEAEIIGKKEWKYN